MALKDRRLLCVAMGGGEGKAAGLRGVCFTAGTEQNAMDLEARHLCATVGVVDSVAP